MLAYQLLGFSRGININTGCSVGLFTDTMPPTVALRQRSSDTQQT